MKIPHPNAPATETIAPKPGEAHKMPDAEYFQLVADMRAVGTKQACCSIHAAQAAVLVAVASLCQEYGEAFDAVAKQMQNLTNHTMNQVRSGRIRFGIQERKS